MRPDATVSGLRGAALEELMVRYQDADAAAVSALVDELSPLLYRFFANQLGSRAEAADMLQDTWLRIHRVRHTYRAGAPLLPWVYAIAHRVRVDSYRRRRRREAQEIAVDALPERSGAENASEPKAALDELLAPLPESQRAVLTMLKVEGLSIEDVATATSSTAGAVKQKVHRAYERLRDLMRAGGRAEDRK